MQSEMFCMLLFKGRFRKNIAQLTHFELHVQLISSHPHSNEIIIVFLVFLWMFMAKAAVTGAIYVLSLNEYSILRRQDVSQERQIFITFLEKQ